MDTHEPANTAGADDPLIGRLFGGAYKLKRCVGLGASGSVYEAEQVSLGRTVAVKVLRPDLAEDDRLVRRFHDEALAASRLNHPNTVAVFEYGQTRDNLLYIVMEFLGGPTLTQVLRQRGPFEASAAVAVMHQILSGLEEAHACGVVHADLKADNVVLLRRRDGTELAKVVDFGIARIVGAPRRANQEKVICGTPEYMAPELIAGADPTVESDLYAAGVLLYELITGETPFSGAASAIDTLTRHLREQPAAPSKRRPDLVINERIEAACLRALAKKASDRFASAADFRHALATSIGRRPSGEHETSEALCPSCGVMSAASFKFCPECGQPRTVPERRTTREYGVSRLHELLRQPTGATETLQDAPALLDRPLDEDSADGVFPLPMIGRGAELDEVTAFLRATEAPTTLQVVGERGSGRSRLAREACAAVAREGAFVYLAGADPTGMASPFYPVRAIVAALLDLPPVCPYESLGAAIERLGLTRRDLPGIAELFGHESELWQLEPPVRRRELLASTIRVLRAACADVRTVLVFDDVDQYDTPSLELLRRLAELDGPANLRVLVTTGGALAERWPPGVARVDVPPLSDGQLAAVAMHLHSVTHNDALPDAAMLAHQTAGDPAHIHQLVRFVLEGGSCDTAPRAIADLVVARIELLPQTARMVLQACAAIGGECTRQQVHDLVGPAVGTQAVDDGLALLDARTLLVVEDDAVWFHQALVRDIAYASTPGDVRRALHAAAAHALEATGAEPAVLGHHHERAGHLRQAAELLSLAGDESVHQLDDQGACRLYNRALDAARQLILADDDPELHTLFAEISVKLAEALRVRGEIGLARGLIDEASEYCRGAPALEAQLKRALGHLYLTVGDIPAAGGSLRDGIALALQTGKVDLLAELYLDLSTAYLRGGEARAAASELEEGINLVTLGGGASADEGPAELWRMLLRLTQLYRSLGRADEAVKLGEAALAQARRAHSGLGRARSQALLAELLETHGERDRAADYRQAAVDEMRRLGDRRGTAELLLSGTSPTTRLVRIRPGSLREARELAKEIGWTEGVLRAQKRLT